MCAIAYEPCDDQSFRINPNRPAGQAGMGGSGFSDPSAAPPGLDIYSLYLGHYLLTSKSQVLWLTIQEC